MLAEGGEQRGLGRQNCGTGSESEGKGQYQIWCCDADLAVGKTWLGLTRQCLVGDGVSLLLLGYVTAGGPVLFSGLFNSDSRTAIACLGCLGLCWATETRP